MTSDLPFGPLPNAGGTGTGRDEGIADEALRIEFDFAYQPIVAMSTRSVFAHEALVRGPNGEGAITVLSQVSRSNRHRFDQACRMKATKRATDLGIVESLSINFLPNAVKAPESCIRTTREAVRVYGFSAERLIFEVSERDRIEDAVLFADIVREYRRLGFRTAIDDFGAGYSGMRLLADFQPDIIKLDMQIIRGIDKQPYHNSCIAHQNSPRSKVWQRPRSRPKAPISQAPLSSQRFGAGMRA